MKKYIVSLFFLASFIFIGSSAVQAGVDDDPSLVVWYKFNEGAGTKAVNSAPAGGGINGTLVNSPTWTTGKINGALLFVPTSNYSTNPRVDTGKDWTGTNAATACAWIAPQNASYSTSIFDNDDFQFMLSSSGSNQLIFTSNGDNVIFSASNSVQVSSIAPKWQYVCVSDAVTNDISYPTLYIFNGQNGAQPLIQSSQNGIGAPATWGYDINIGAGIGGGGSFNGAIADVRIYTRTLSAAEITTIYQEAFGPETTSPTVPTNVSQVSVSLNSATISWTASSDVRAIAGYIVYRNGTAVNGPGTSNPSLVTGLSFTDSGLTGDTTYSYTVAAVNSSNLQSGPSTPALSITTLLPNTTPPSVPTNLQTNFIYSTEVGLLWSASTAAVAGQGQAQATIAGYIIYRNGTAINNLQHLIISPAYIDTGLTANTTYTYTVSAVDTENNVSAQSNPLIVSTNNTPAMPWTGIIDPKRAMDWRGAGIPGGLPDGNWTQCGATVAAYTGDASTINNAIAPCGPNTYVLLGPGTFNLSSSIDFQVKSNFVLRGSGANSTFLVFSNYSWPSDIASDYPTFIGISGNKVSWYSSPVATVYNWTGGYAQGSNTITLSGTSGITTTSAGNPTLLVLNQDDDGYSGYPAVGSSVDNGNYFVCTDYYETSPSITGCSVEGPDGTPPSPFTHRWQEEIVTATAINGNTVTISPPLKHPNWRSSQVPTAMLITPSAVNDGVEDLSIDMQNNQAVYYAIFFWGVDKGWVSGVRIMNGYWREIGSFYSTHLQIQSNYLFNGSGWDPYAIRFNHSADNLIVNNILQKSGAPIVFDNPDTGTVIAYNFTIDDQSSTASDTMTAALWDHSASDDFHLWEGNIASGIMMDYIHGTHLDETVFRNFFPGWESCANGQCGTATAKDFGTSAVTYNAYNRYGNIVGNVLGTPGWTYKYQTPLDNIGDDYGGEGSVYYLGGGNPGTNPPIPADPLTPPTILIWGNYDVVTGAARWCGNSTDTGWSGTCAGTSEIPTLDPNFPNPVPIVGDIGAGQGTLPASFYYSSKPSWWGSLPWPAIGPDVSNGNVGQCSGTLNASGLFNGVAALNQAQCAGQPLVNGWAGHVNANPAMNCALNIMGMPPDGTGSVLPFDPSKCYGQTSVGSGDVSGDGTISAYDAAMAAAGSTNPEAEVSGGGGVTNLDAALIAQRAVGLITKFPVEG